MNPESLKPQGIKYSNYDCNVSDPDSITDVFYAFVLAQKVINPG